MSDVPIESSFKTAVSSNLETIAIIGGFQNVRLYSCDFPDSFDINTLNAIEINSYTSRNQLTSKESPFLDDIAIRSLFGEAIKAKHGCVWTVPESTELSRGIRTIVCQFIPQDNYLANFLLCTSEKSMQVC